MELDREKLIRAVGEAIGVDLMRLRTFKLEFEKGAKGGLLVKINLWDENLDVAKKTADGLVARFALPVAAQTPPEPRSSAVPGPLVPSGATLAPAQPPSPVQSP